LGGIFRAGARARAADLTFGNITMVEILVVVEIGVERVGEFSPHKCEKDRDKDKEAFHSSSPIILFN
jgi:hypothetical protein